ncbi:MAG TPA: outer membrane beta-barrel protein, partial [Bacteroidia bacterium]|nr:outer membrane beta-barrel protein [Bacteroidia bacterium]
AKNQPSVSKQLAENSKQEGTVSSGQIAESKQEETKPVLEENNNVSNTSEKNLNVPIEKTTESKGTSRTKIQLGAFKHKANLAAFNKIPYKVIEVRGNDGYTRYYAETDETDALNKIQHAGFTGAFVKDDLNTGTENTIVKNQGERSTVSSEQAAVNSGQLAVNGKRLAVGSKLLAGNSEQLAVSSKREQGTAKQETKQPVAGEQLPNNSEQLAVSSNPEQGTAKQETKQPVAGEQSAGNSEQLAVSSKPEQGTVKQETKEPGTGEQLAANSEQPIITKTDSLITNSPVAAAENKQDSLPQKQEKKDSLLTSATTGDTTKKLPFKPEWALSLLGGANIFMPGTQSTLFIPANEKHPGTPTGELKLQYRPFKYFSFSGGMNFTYYTAKQDATYFKFDKYRQEDFLFYSSFGSTPVPMKTMLDGYYFNALTDTFSAHYAYSASLQTLNIPLQANFHFLNTKWVNLSLGLGANGSFAISQQTHLTVIKENFNNDVYYNKVTVNRFSAMLMIGLGCDVRITKHWYVTLAPSYKYGITNMSSVNGTSFKPGYLSASGGIKFKFD